MTMLVSLAQTKARLRFDHNDEDADLQFMIEAASQMVLHYLKTDESFFAGSEFDTGGTWPTDSDGVLIGASEYPEIQTAVIYLAGMLKRDPDGVEMEKWQHGYLPMPAMAMLYPLRDPAMR
jgi:hypothetical protein